MLITDIDAPAVPLGPRPAPLGSGRTASGELPYPEPTDYLGQTARYLRDLADAATVMLANPGLVTSAAQVGTDGNGLCAIRFTALTALAGAVVCPAMLSGMTAYSAVFPQMRWITGNQIEIKWQWMRQGASGAADWTAPQVYGNNALTVMAFGWGST